MTVTLPIATTFCEATLPLFDGLSFYLDGNSKITRGNGTYLAPKPNAFSLPAASVGDAGACPGSTATCRSSCYVHGIAKHAPDLYGRYQQNAAALATILADTTGRYMAWSAIKLGMWIEDNAPHGFRWHVSGDVLSLKHAEWIVNVCANAPDVPFWIYTRTLEAVGVLSTAFNLAVNVSADKDNFKAARAEARRHGARLCYLITDDEPHAWTPFHENAPRFCPRCDEYEDGSEKQARGCVPLLPAGSVIFPDYPLRKRAGSSWFDALTHEQKIMACPTDVFGQSEAHRCGPCRKCF